MSTIETPSAPPYRKPSRWQRFFVGSALVLAGVIVGVGSTALSQGYGRGWSDDGPGRHDRFDGPRGFFRDHDGDGDGGWHHGPGFGGFGGPFLSPGRIERMVDRLGWAVDASSEQKQKIAAVVQRAADDLRPLREKHLEGRRAMRDVLAAATIDRGKLEALRTEQMKLADEASRRIAAAVTEAAEVLTPEQRADLARRLERFGGRRG